MYLYLEISTTRKCSNIANNVSIGNFPFALLEINFHFVRNGIFENDIRPVAKETSSEEKFLETNVFFHRSFENTTIKWS